MSRLRSIGCALVAVLSVAAGVSAQTRSATHESLRVGLSVAAMGTPEFDSEHHSSEKSISVELPLADSYSTRVDVAASGPEFIVSQPDFGIDSQRVGMWHVRFALVKTTADAAARAYGGLGYGLYRLNTEHPFFKSGPHAFAGIRVPLGSSRAALHAELGVDSFSRGRDIDSPFLFAGRAGMGVSLGLGPRVHKANRSPRRR
jgi:hypothetical protein